MPVIAVRRTLARKATTIGKYEVENSNAAALRDSRPRMISEKAPCDYSRSATDSVQESREGVVKCSRYKTKLLNSQSTLKLRNAIILLHI